YCSPASSLSRLAYPPIVGLFRASLGAVAPGSPGPAPRSRLKHAATTEIYTLSLHDALPILAGDSGFGFPAATRFNEPGRTVWARSEEHTSELQSRENLVCRLLLEKKKAAPGADRPPDRAPRPAARRAEEPTPELQAREKIAW